jgi:hypothetical protein
MQFHRLSANELLKALGVGIGAALILSAITVPAFLTGISPLPKPPSLAFAEVILGRSLPLPVGLLFHVVYVTAWSVAFVVLFRDRLSFLRALALALLLWLVALAVFFPIIGWGFFGLAVGPKLIVGALMPHLLFAVILWGLCRLVFARGRMTG